MDPKMNSSSADPLSAASIEEGGNRGSQEEDLDRCFCLSWKGTPLPTKGCCGLEVEERPQLDVWLPEDKYALRMPVFFAVLALISTLIWLIDQEQFDVIKPPPVVEFLQGSLAGVAILVLYFPLGALVWCRGWSVAFTRKVSHILVMTAIPATTIISDHGHTLARLIFLSAVWNSLSLTMLLSVLFLQPVRKYFYPSKIGFAAVERSEDRPLANLWVLFQATAMTMVQTPMIEWMLKGEKGLLIWIPFMAVGLGDGLAEPVGRMYGKHKYEVTALFTTKKYTRSYEGSATVFVFTFIAVLIGLPEMNWVQGALCILTVPIGNTVVEAISPHTWDNHFMFGISWLLLWLIFDVLPTDEWAM